MSQSQKLVSYMAAVTLCCVAATFAIAAVPPEARKEKSSASGLAILQEIPPTLVDANKPFGNYMRRYRVVAVIDQPADGKAVAADATIGWLIRAEDLASSDPSPPGFSPNLVLLERIGWKDGTIEARDGVSIRLEELTRGPQRLTEFESKAFRSDVLKLRSAKTKSEKAAAFALLAASTATPSGALLIEGEDLSHDTRLSSDDRLKICEGVLSLAVRAEAPEYVRNHALHALGSVALFADRGKFKEWNVREVAAMLDAFHDWVNDPKRDVAYPESLLHTLLPRLSRPWIKSALQLRERFDRFPKDLAAYEKKLEQTGDEMRMYRIRGLEPRIRESLAGDAARKQ